MNNEKTLPSSEREFERGFGWTLLLSFAAHLAIIAALVLAPGFVLRPQPPLKSYTVDLVDPSKLGGTNLVAGSKGKSAGPPKVEPAKAKEAEPPPPPPEEAKAEPPPPPEPPKPEEKHEPPPPPKPEAAKPPEPPKVDEKAVALEKKAEATPTRPQEVAKAEVPTAAPVPPTATAKSAPTAVKAEPTKPKPTIAKVQATATAPAKAVAKAAATPTPAKGAGKTPPQAVAKAQTSPGAKPNTTPAKPGTSAAPGKATPAAQAKGEADAKARDDRIAAAIKRVEQQAGTRGAGSGNAAGNAPGGPISLGPGEGAGGEVRSLATIMYTNRIQAMIKEKWAWAGAKALKADIGFTIQPDGAVTNVRTVTSSGDASYDKMAETAVRAASPFPAPPQECQEEFANNGFLYTFEPE